MVHPEHPTVLPVLGPTVCEVSQSITPSTTKRSVVIYATSRLERYMYTVSGLGSLASPSTLTLPHYRFVLPSSSTLNTTDRISRIFSYRLRSVRPTSFHQMFRPSPLLPETSSADQPAPGVSLESLCDATTLKRRRSSRLGWNILLVPAALVLITLAAPYISHPALSDPSPGFRRAARAAGNPPRMVPQNHHKTDR